MNQTRIDSVMEALTNTAVGYVISVAANLAILPLFGLHTSIRAAAGIGLAFTVVSVARQYTLRRLFNGRSIWAAIKGRPSPAQGSV